MLAWLPGPAPGPAPAASTGPARPLDQFGEVLDDDVGPFLSQYVGLAHPVHPDHPAEAAGSPRGHPGLRVLVDGGRCGRDVKHPGGGQVGVRGGLAAQPLAVGHLRVHDDLEVVDEPGGGQHRAAVGARRDHRAAAAGSDHGAQVADRAGIRLHAFLIDPAQQDLIFVVAQRPDGLGRRVIVVAAVGQFDTPGGQERPRPVRPGLAIHISAIIRDWIKRYEQLSGPGRAPPQEGIEHLLPGRGMYQVGLGKHAVEVEKTGADPCWRRGHQASLEGTWRGRADLRAGGGSERPGRPVVSADSWPRCGRGGAAGAVRQGRGKAGGGRQQMPARGKAGRGRCRWTRNRRRVRTLGMPAAARPDPTGPDLTCRASGC